MFTISTACHDFGLRAGAILFRDVTVADAPRELRAAIDTEAQRIRDQFNSPAELRALPEMARHHEILRRVGVKPKDNPPSTQKLMEYAYKRGTLPSVNNLVDAYNYSSIRTTCSLGAHDLECIELPVALQVFRAGTTFRPLGGRQDSAVGEGEFGYVDARNRVLCRLDSLQADFSKVTPHTKHVLLIIESTTAVARDELASVFAATEELVVRNCGGSAVAVKMPA